MAEIGSAHIKFTSDDSSVNRAFLKVDKGFKRMSKTANAFDNLMKGVAGQMTIAFAGVFAIQKVTQFFSTATKGALEFERGMTRINTVTQLSADGLRKLEGNLRGLADKMAVPLDDLQNGLFDVASAGIEAGSQIDFLTASAAFAAVGVFDVATAVKGLTAILKGYGLGLADTERIMDLFLQTNVKGQTTLEELSTSVQDVTAVARNAGISLEEFFAVFATGTGVTGNAARVATQFKGAINALAAPTKETSQKFKDMGINVGRAAIEQEGFVGLAKKIYDAVGGDAEQLRRLIPEIEATTLITALATTQFDRFNKNLQANQGELNLTVSQYQEFGESASGQLALVGNEWENLKDTVGNAVIFMLSAMIKWKNDIEYIFAIGSNRVGTWFSTQAAGFFGFLESAATKRLGPEVGQQFGFLKEGFRGEALALQEDYLKIQTGQERTVSALKDALSNLAGSSQVFASESGKVAGNIGKVNSSLKGEKESMEAVENSIDDIENAHKKWQDGIEKTADKLEQLAEKNKALMKDIRKQIKDTSKEMRNLEAGFAQESSAKRGDFWEQMADDIVKYTNERKKLEGQGELSDSDLSRIEELKKLEQEARKYLVGQTVSGSAGNRIFQDLVGQAETRAERSDVQIKIDEYNAEQEARARNFEEEKAILEERQLILQQIRDGEKVNLEKIENEKNLQIAEEMLAKKAQIEQDIKLTQDQQKQLTKAWQEGAIAIEGVNDELIGRLDTKYQALAARIKSYLASASGSSGGGEAGFAGGGLTGAGADGDVAGVVHRNEYVIPSKVLSRLMPTGLIGTIEKMRRGFAGGGFTSDGMQSIANKTINLNQQNTIREGIDLDAFNQRLLFEINRY